MKVEFTSEGYRDFSQRYSGTFGWLERKDKNPVLVQLQNVNSDELTFIDANRIEYFARSDRDNWFSFIPVKKGSYLYKDGIVVVQRRPARQWKRGICEDNTTITTLGDKQPLSVTFDILSNIFSPQYNYTVEKFRSFKGGDLVLFNNQFSIYNNVMYLYDIPIGQYKEGKLVLESDVFQQEVKDVFMLNRVDVEVV